MTEATTRQARTLAGRYALGEAVGQGGMATVYRGTDTKLGRQVAIKIMKAELADDDKFRERFRHEAQAASRMAHPNIVRVFDAGDDLIQTASGPKQLPFIVMEYVEGKNLREHLNNRSFNVEEACKVVSVVLSALEYSHKAGIVHRDIKPANIMITNSGQVKVMDFGIARAVSETSSTLQQTTQILGTAAYFSPEQAKGESVDHRSDLYSTGVMLYELLTGRVPFKGDSAVSVAYQHVTERPVPPSNHAPHVSAAIDRVVLHALVKNKLRRFQSASDFNAAITAALAGQVQENLNIDQYDSDFLSSMGGDRSNEFAAELYELDTKKTQTRPPVMWIWASVVTLIVVIAAMLVWLLNLAPTQFSASSQIPELAGIQKDQAITKLTDLQLGAVTVEKADPRVPEGAVISTNPEPGVRLAKGDKVTIFVSSGPEKPELPNLVGDTKESAEAKLQALGLSIGEINTKDDTRSPKDSILEMSPAAGTKVAKGSKISITVASGKVNIPDVKGQSLAAAQTILREKNVNVKVTPRSCEVTASGVPIIEQSLVGSQDANATVEIVYCAGTTQNTPPNTPPRRQ